MSVKFLSDEWAEALKAELNLSDAFRQAAAGQKATIQQVISGAEGETHYWITIDDGSIDLGTGDIEGEDATITQSYDTAAALAKGELSPVTAFYNRCAMNLLLPFFQRGKLCLSQLCKFGFDFWP